MIIALVIFLLVLIGKLIFDLHLYFSDKPNKHFIGPIIVVIALAICSWLAGWLSIQMWFLNWWMLFDGFYGLFIGHGFFYVGTTAKLDILQRKYQLLFWFKYIAAPVSIILYIMFK